MQVIFQDPQDSLNPRFTAADIVGEPLRIHGLANGKDREAGKVLRGKEVPVIIDLHLGKSSAKVLTCDLTEEYIRVNATYRT